MRACLRIAFILFCGVAIVFGQQTGGRGGSPGGASSCDTLSNCPAIDRANTFTATQTFNANTIIGPSSNLSSTAPGFASWTLLAHAGTGNASLQLLSVSNAAFVTLTRGSTGVQALSMGNDDSGTQFTDSAVTDVNVAAPAGQALRLGTGFGTVSAIQIIGQAVAHTANTIAASATPAITTASLQTITLTGPATPTVTIVPGEHLVLQICQDGTGSRTWTWPAAIHGGVTIGATANTCTEQAFDSFNGTTLVAENAGVTLVAP